MLDNKEITIIPICKITPSYLVTYPSFEGRKKSKLSYDITQHNQKERTYNGYMSPNTTKKVTQYLTTWIDSITRFRSHHTTQEHDRNVKLTFITLTLPCKQYHPDKEIKSICLIPFIQLLKIKYNIKNYFWRAESQKNGNIHFHILIDKFIQWELIRELWNNQINKLGYINIYSDNQKQFHKNGFKLSHNTNDKRTTEQQHAAYIEGTINNWSNPNSTDIHSLKRLRSIANYVVKYVCKSDGIRPIQGRIHGCSDQLKIIKQYSVVIDYNIQEAINAIDKFPGTKKIIKDYAEITIGKIMLAAYTNSYYLYQKIQTHLNNIFLQLYGTFINIIQPEPIPIQSNPIQPKSNPFQSYLFT